MKMEILGDRAPLSTRPAIECLLQVRNNEHERRLAQVKHLHYSQRNEERIAATIMPPANRNLLAAANRNKPLKQTRATSDTAVYIDGELVRIIPRRKPRTTAPKQRKHRIVVVPDPPRKRERLATDYTMGDTWQSAGNAQNDPKVDPNWWDNFQAEVARREAAGERVR